MNTIDHHNALGSPFTIISPNTCVAYCPRPTLLVPFDCWVNFLHPYDMHVVVFGVVVGLVWLVGWES